MYGAPLGGYAGALPALACAPAFITPGHRIPTPAALPMCHGGAPVAAVAARPPLKPVKGLQIEVFSNGQQQWFSGIIDVVIVVDSIVDGMNVPAGGIFVTSDAGSKWIMPDQIPHVVRAATAVRARTPPCAAAPSPHKAAASPRTAAATPHGAHAVGVGAALSPASVPAEGSPLTMPSDSEMCKFNCGRPVQQGLTKGMRHYDTCCKACVRLGGDGPHDDHDDNCMGQAKRDARRHATGPRVITPVVEAKKTMQDWLNPSSPSLERHVSIILSNDFGSQDGRLQKSQVDSLVGDKLFACWFQQPDVHATQTTTLHSQQVRDMVTREQLVQICREAITIQYSMWFPEILQVSTKSFVSQNMRPLETVYMIGRKLGEGSFGTVFGCTHKISGETRVCKKISKSAAVQQTETEILQEIQNMAMLDHPGVIKVFEFFNDSHYVSQIMEPCNGGELQDRIDDVFKKGMPKYTETFMRDVLKQTLRALAFMHSRKFVHKDLKPQNIMMTEKGGSSIKVIDFGMAEMFNKGQTTASFVGGTLLYMSPQCFVNAMTTKCDIWSTGVILYNLITGQHPFAATWPPPPGRDTQWWEVETINIITTRAMAPHPEVSKASYQCRSLLEMTLTKDPNSRPSAAVCLRQQWFKDAGHVAPTLSVGVTQCLDVYARMPEMKKVIFLLMAHQSASSGLQELQAIFTHFDERNVGRLSSRDLQRVLADCGMAPVAVDRVIHALDRDNTSEISWTEFTAAAICVSVCGNRKLVDAAFAHFDSDGDGKITPQDLERVMAGTPATRERWIKRSHDLQQEMQELGSTRDHFRAYVGQKLHIKGGSFFYAVR